MKEMKLTQGQVTIVDDDDYKRFGHFKWHYSHGRAVRRGGYKVRYTQWLHRDIMGNPEGLLVDHINGNPLDNRKENLRLCLQSDNMANARKWTRSTSSKYKGVCWDKVNNRWETYITYRGKRQRMGRYKKEKDAAKAYNEKAAELFGDFAKLNLLS